MPGPYAGGSPGTRDGLIAQGIELFAAGWAYLRARLELASIEGKEAGVHWIKALAFLIAALVILVFGYFFFVLAAIFAIAFAIGGKTAWIWVTLGAALLHAGGAALLLMKVRGLVSAPFFPVTLDEFRKDQAWLDAKTGRQS